MEISGELKTTMHDWHHIPTSGQDKLAGDMLAVCIGDTFINFNEDSPLEQWTTIAHILRVYGFKFSFKQPPPRRGYDKQFSKNYDI